jgi:HEAT repeat protein
MQSGDSHLSLVKLIGSLQDGDPVVRVHAAFAIGSLGENAAPVIPVLVELLRFGDVQERKLALTTLGLIGAAATDALPCVREVLDYDDEDSVARVAMRVLDEIEGVTSRWAAQAA